MQKPAGSASWLLPVESVGNGARIRAAGSKTNNFYCTIHIFRANPEAASQLQRQGLIMTGAEVVTWTAASEPLRRLPFAEKCEF